MIRRLAPFVLVATLGLGACASDGSPQGTATSPDAPVLQPGTPGEPNASLSGTSAVATPTSGHNAADVEFLQDMVVHHAQAVVMSELVGGDLQDARVKKMAERIKAEQKPEMKGMATTLRAWGEKVPIQATNPAPTPVTASTRTCRGWRRRHSSTSSARRRGPPPTACTST